MKAALAAFFVMSIFHRMLSTPVPPKAAVHPRQRGTLAVPRCGTGLHLSSAGGGGPWLCTGRRWRESNEISQIKK